MRVVQIHAEEPRDERHERHRKHAGGQKQLQLNQLVTVGIQFDVEVVLRRDGGGKLLKGLQCADMPAASSSYMSSSS